MKEKRYEAAYAGFVYEAPATHWTPSTVVRQRLTKMDFTKPDGIELGGMPIMLLLCCPSTISKNSAFCNNSSSRKKTYRNNRHQ